MAMDWNGFTIKSMKYSIRIIVKSDDMIICKDFGTIIQASA